MYYGSADSPTDGPNITGGVHFQLLTPTNVDLPVFQLTCISTSSPPTTVQWTINGSSVNGGNYASSQIVTDRPTSTYKNTLTVTGRASGMYACTVTTTCSPVCGPTGFTLNPRSTTSSLSVSGKYYTYEECFAPVGMYHPLYRSSCPTHWCHCCATWSHICQCLLDCTNFRWSSEQI